MRGLRPERREIDPRAGTRRCDYGVGHIAQALEWLGEPKWRKRALDERQGFTLGGANSKLDRSLGEIGVGADAGDRRLESRDVPSERVRADRDLTLEDAAGKRRGQATLALDLLKQPPRALAKRLGERLERARAGGGVGDKSKIGFAQEDELRVAGETPGETVGKTGGERVGKHADAVGAPEASRERRHRPAHDVHGRVTRRHHAPGAFGMDMRRARLKAACGLDP